MGARDSRFDLLKAIAIGMVVLGHVISMRELAPQGSGHLGALIVGLNMPLFFAISGYFSVRAVESLGAVVWRCAKFLRAMAAYSALLTVVFYGLGVWGTPLLAAKRFITIPSGWWFMWVLMLAMLVTWLMKRLLSAGRGKWGRVAVVLPLGVYLGLLAIPDTWWQMHDLKFCLPYFVMGLALREANVLTRLRRNVSLIVWIVAASCYGVYVIGYQFFPCSFYWADFNLRSIVGSWNSIGTFFVRHLIACAGVLMVTLPILFVRPGRAMDAVAELGTTTMGVYFLHQCILRYWIVPHYIGNAGVSFLTLLSITLVLWLGCHALVCFIRQHKILAKIFT